MFFCDGILPCVPLSALRLGGFPQGQRQQGPYNANVISLVCTPAFRYNAVIPSGSEVTGLTTVYTYRISATGVWQYGFYENQNLIGHVNSMVGPNATTRIEAEGLS